MSREQSPSAVVMVRPHRFYPNPETAADNAFQQSTSAAEDYSQAAQTEFDKAAATLRDAGVTVHVFQDTATPDKPDAVFPNNWFSTHGDGRIVLYPMFSPSRRMERRQEVIDGLRKAYQVKEVVDYTSFEKEGLYLEGTGSMVLDRSNRLAYVSLSQRSCLEPLRRFCRDFEYEAICFRSSSRDGRPIYHTNVMMCLGSEFALVGLDAIGDAIQRGMVRESLEAGGWTIVPLDQTQIEEFAGNALELSAASGKLLVLSSRALAALTNEQRKLLEGFARLLPLSLPTIERAGGSARCMLATIHLPRAQPSSSSAQKAAPGQRRSCIPSREGFPHLP